MITKEAKNRDLFTINKFFFNSARTAFSILLSKLLSGDDKILMPAYIGQSPREGSGVFDPIRQTKSNYVFYKLKDNLQVDIEDVEVKINADNIRAILLIHYFGFPQKEIFRIKELCARNNVILIEDCAHTLTSSVAGKKLGDIGDFAFYSLHKLLACEDGGCLQVNNCKYIDVLHGIKENIAIEDLLQYSKTDIKATSEKRVNNYKYYLSILRSDSNLFDVMYPVLEDGVVPLNFPILIKNYDRFKLYNELIERGAVTVSLYYQMINELNEHEYPESFKISSTILNLPVHQETTVEDIECICEMLNNWNQ